MSEANSRKIQSLAVAPVVSADSNSQEAQMARSAKAIQLQGATDSAFDTVVERFCGSSGSSGSTVTLLGLSIVASLFLASLLYQKRR